MPTGAPMNDVVLETNTTTPSHAPTSDVVVEPNTNMPTHVPTKNVNGGTNTACKATKDDPDMYNNYTTGTKFRSSRINRGARPVHAESVV